MIAQKNPVTTLASVSACTDVLTQMSDHILKCALYLMLTPGTPQLVSFEAIIYVCVDSRLDQILAIFNIPQNRHQFRKSGPGNHLRSLMKAYSL